MTHWIKHSAHKIMLALIALTDDSKRAYAASGISAVTAALTFQQVVSIFFGGLTLIIAGFTAWSNHKKNVAQRMAAEAQRKLAESNIRPIGDNDGH